jgi:hypothetical protein
MDSLIKQDINLSTNSKPFLQGFTSIGELNISQICSFCLFAGRRILTYLSKVVLAACPLEQLRLYRCSNSVNWQLETVERACNVNNKPVPKFIIRQILATTKVRQRCNNKILVVEKTLFDITTNLEENSLKKIHPVNLVQLCSFVIFQGLHCISQKLLATNGHSRDVTLSVRNCIRDSLQMQKDLINIFTSLPFQKASTSVKINEIQAIHMKVEILEKKKDLK